MFKITNDQVQWFEKAELEDAKKLADAICGVVIVDNRIIYSAPKGFYS